jgi:hypothetical protein
LNKSRSTTCISRCRNLLVTIHILKSWQECQLSETHTKTLSQALRLEALTQVFTPEPLKTSIATCMALVVAMVAAAAAAAAAVMAAVMAAVLVILARMVKVLVALVAHPVNLAQPLEVLGLVAQVMALRLAVVTAQLVTAVLALPVVMELLAMAAAVVVAMAVAMAAVALAGPWAV